MERTLENVNPGTGNQARSLAATLERHAPVGGLTAPALNATSPPSSFGSDSVCKTADEFGNVAAGIIAEKLQITGLAAESLKAELKLYFEDIGVSNESQLAVMAGGVFPTDTFEYDRERKRALTCPVMTCLKEMTGMIAVTLRESLYLTENVSFADLVSASLQFQLPPVNQSPGGVTLGQAPTSTNEKLPAYVPVLLGASQNLLLENKGTYDEIREMVKTLHQALVTGEGIRDCSIPPAVCVTRGKSNASGTSRPSKNQQEKDAFIEKYERCFPPNTGTQIPQHVYNQIKAWWDCARWHPSRRTRDQEVFLKQFRWCHFSKRVKKQKRGTRKRLAPSQKANDRADGLEKPNNDTPTSTDQNRGRGTRRKKRRPASIHIEKEPEEKYPSDDEPSQKEKDEQTRRGDVYLPDFGMWVKPETIPKNVKNPKDKFLNPPRHLTDEQLLSMTTDDDSFGDSTDDDMDVEDVNGDPPGSVHPQKKTALSGKEKQSSTEDLEPKTKNKDNFVNLTS